MNLYIGNLSSDVNNHDLKELFGTKGDIKSAKVIMDHDISESRGFGFVEMFTKAEGTKAMSSLNGHELKGKTITVNEARPKNNDRQRSQYRSLS